MEKSRKGFAITSLILGIVGFFVYGIIFGTLAIIFGALSWEEKMGKAGFIVGLIDVIAVLFFLSLS